MNINIAYGADEKFTRYTYLSILSMLENTKGTDKITVFLITLKNNKYIPAIKNLETIYPFFELKTVFIKKEDFEDLKISSKYINFGTYLRFAIDGIKGIEKIIYIDGDTIINGDIVSLFNEDLENNIVGTCSDMPTKSVKILIKELNLQKNMYFNAGVMLIDLNKRKEFGVTKKCMELLRERTYKCLDQDPLNIVLQNHCKYLPGKYNSASGYHCFVDGIENFCYVGFDKQYYIDAIKSPVIVHYTGNLKPWHFFNEHPYRYLYDNILYKSSKIKGGIKLSKKERFVLIFHKIEGIIPYKLRRFVVNKLKKIF